MKMCEWAVVADYGTNNRVVAVFRYPAQAQDFIDMCLPEDTRDRFKVVDINKVQGD